VSASMGRVAQAPPIGAPVSWASAAADLEAESYRQARAAILEADARTRGRGMPLIMLGGASAGSGARS